MSREQQPERPDEKQLEREPITYGDVFSVSGGLAKEPITAKDAALMQSAETRALGNSQKGGAAAIMQLAADINEKAGLLNRNRTPSAGGDVGMTVTETAVPGQVLRTEYIAGQVIKSELTPAPTEHDIAANDAITIGQALRAAAIKVGNKPIDEGDARAIQSAEKRATGFPMSPKGGLGATAQSAAQLNPRVDNVGKTTLSNVLMAAPEDLGADKAVTREDADKVMEAETRGAPRGHPQPGGVGEAMQAAAKLNEQMGAALAVHAYGMEDVSVIGRHKTKSHGDNDSTSGVDDPSARHSF